LHKHNHRKEVKWENIDHLIRESSPLLGENRNGVEYTSLMVRMSKINFDRMMLCVELCVLWSKEIGDECVRGSLND